VGLLPEECLQVWAMVTAPGSSPPTAKRIKEVIHEQRVAGLLEDLEQFAEDEAEDDAEDDAEDEDGAEVLRYSISGTVVARSDTDPKALEKLLGTGQVHWVLKNGRNKTLAVVRMETVSLERLP